MTKKLLIKFFNDHCSEEEIAEVIRWVKNEALNNQSKEIGLSEWENVCVDNNLLDKEKYDSLLDKIHHKINISQKASKGNRYLHLTAKWLTKVAAILLLPVLVLLIYSITNKSDFVGGLSNFTVDSLEIVTPVGSQTVVQLSDGSEVYLNHGSKLKYPQKFNGKTREVLLTGEGYFNIAHNPEKPFTVRTSDLNITALGTSFNVLAYPDDNVIEATLVEGKLLVEESLTPTNKRLIGTMVPSQHIRYNKLSDKVSSTKGDIEKYIAWKDGKLIFKNESIVEITKRLSRWYNVEFEFKDDEARKFTYTATFVDETLFQILDLMKIATPINYRTIARNKLPDGTYTKQRIIIEKRNK